MMVNKLGFVNILVENARYNKKKHKIQEKFVTKFILRGIQYLTQIAHFNFFLMPSTFLWCWFLPLQYRFRLTGNQLL